MVTFPDETTDFGDQVRVISQVEAGGPSRLVVVPCAAKQILTTLEELAANGTEELLSMHFLVSRIIGTSYFDVNSVEGRAVYRKTKLQDSNESNSNFHKRRRRYVSSMEKLQTIASVPVAMNLESVDMKYDAKVVLEGHFPQRLYLGRPKLLQNRDPRHQRRSSNRLEGFSCSGVSHHPSGAVTAWATPSLACLSSPYVLSLLPYDNELYTACQRQGYQHHWYNGKRQFPTGRAQPKSQFLL